MEGIKGKGLENKEAEVKQKTEVKNMIERVMKSKMISCVKKLLGKSVVGFVALALLCVYVGHTQAVSIDFNDGTAEQAIGSFYSALGVTFQNVKWRTNWAVGNDSDPSNNNEGLGIASINGHADGDQPKKETALVGIFGSPKSMMSIRAYDVGEVGARIDVYDAEVGGNLIGSQETFGGGIGVGNHPLLSVSVPGIRRFELYQPLPRVDYDGLIWDNLSFSEEQTGPLQAPVVDPIPVPVEANYLGTWGGGKFITVTGNGRPGARVTVIVRTAGQRFDQDAVTVGGDGRWSAQAGIFGGQGQAFDINSYQVEGGSNFSPESPIQSTSLLLLVPAPVVDEIPSSIGSALEQPTISFIVKGNSLPGASITVVVIQSAVRIDQPSVVADSSGRWSATVSVTNINFGKGIPPGSGPIEIFAFSVIGSVYSPESEHQTTSVQSTPDVVLDPIPDVVHAPYIRADHGGKFIAITGRILTTDIRLLVYPIVWRGSERFDQPSVLSDSNGEFVATVGLFGPQEDMLEVQVVLKSGTYEFAQSQKRPTKLQLFVPTPTVDAIPAETIAAAGSGGQTITLTGTAVPGSEVIGVVVTGGQRFDHPVVIAGPDGSYSTQVGILGTNGQSFEVFAFSKIGNDFSPESIHQTTTLKFLLSPPEQVGPIPSVIEAFYTSAIGGGLNRSIGGHAQFGSLVTVIVRTAGQRFDHGPFPTGGSHSNWVGTVGFFGSQGQVFEVSAFAELNGLVSEESPIQTTSLFLLVPPPVLDPVPAQVEGNRNDGGLQLTLTGTAVPGAEVVGVVITGGQRFDHPSVIAGPDGRYSTQVGVLGIEGQQFEIFTYTKIPNPSIPSGFDFSPQSEHFFTALHFPNRPPVANAGSNQTVECAGSGTSVTLSGSGSNDPDGDTLTYTWSEGATTIATGANPSVTLAKGVHNITLVVNDGQVNSEPSTVQITVQDTTPPTINSISVNPAQLWPPNHKMVDVTVSASASDLCDSAPTLKITSITSNEADDGLGDGDTAGDSVITGDFTAQLRAERSGNGNGRVYTITVSAQDSSGNSSTGTVTVTVPHSQKK